MLKRLLDSDFKDIHFLDGEKPVIGYRFGATVYEETFDEGRFVSAGWNTAGYTQNVMENDPRRLPYEVFAEPQSFDVEIDGRSLAFDWQFEGFAKREEKEESNGRSLLHGIVTLRSRILPLVVEVHTILDGTSILTRYISLTNQSAAPMNVSALAPMCGGLEVVPAWSEYQEGTPDPERLYSLGYMESSSWGQEGLFRWHPLPNAGFDIFGRYRRDRYRQPMFMLRNHALGSFFTAQLGWSGGFAFHFDLCTDAVDKGASLYFKVALDSPKPMLVLAPGESYRSPSVHIGCLQGDLDDAVHAMHTHIRASVFTLPDARGRKGWIEAGVGPERIMDSAAIAHIADTAAAVGAEAVIIDAGWYCPPGTEGSEWHRRSGDWFADPVKHPDDFKKVREPIHERGMLFGLWLDAERIGSLSRIFAEHPDWVARRYVTGAKTSMLDMTMPEVAEWVEQQIGRLVDAYGIDLFRLDYNILSGETFLKIRRGGIDECGTIRYDEAVNRMYRNLRLKYPDVVFENCASGGARADLGFMRNFTHTWVSDWQIAPRSFAITNGMTMVLPPESVDRLVSGMGCHTRASLDFQVRHTLFGRPSTNTYNALGSAFHPDQIAFVRHSFVDIYRDFVRTFVEDSRTYHHTPECWRTQPTGVGILERASADGTKGMVGVFHLSGVGNEATVVHPRGLDMSRTYAVTFDNSGATVHVSGYELVHEGIRVRLDGALTSELILYAAVEPDPTH
jgi:alpha-galactosidase